MKKDLNYYLNLPYTIMVKRLEDGDYYAQYADTGLTNHNLLAGWGKSEGEAIEELKEAFACYIEGALKSGEVIYEPIKEDKKVRVNLTIPQSILVAIDAISPNRSKFLTEAARLKLGMAH